MKYDITKPPTRSAKRVLGAMSEALLSLLCKKNFDEITVAELCEASDYPRATFYNYFDDKYDLLDFFWLGISRMVRFEEYSKYSYGELTDVYFDRLYTLFESYESEVTQILEHNSHDGYFISSCRIYLTRSIRTMLENMYTEELIKVPFGVMAEHFANTLLLVFRERFDKSGKKPTKEKTKEYLCYLLFGINGGSL